MDWYMAGLCGGIEIGRELEEAERDAAWLTLARPIAQPATVGRELAAGRLRTVEAACREDAANWERTFVAKAYNTPDHLRNDQQRATVQLYSPIPKRGSAA